MTDDTNYTPDGEFCGTPSNDGYAVLASTVNPEDVRRAEEAAEGRARANVGRWTDEDIQAGRIPEADRDIYVEHSMLNVAGRALAAERYLARVVRQRRRRAALGAVHPWRAAPRQTVRARRPQHRASRPRRVRGKPKSDDGAGSRSRRARGTGRCAW